MTEKRRLRSRVEQLLEESAWLTRKLNEAREEKAASDKDLGRSRHEINEFREMLRRKPVPRAARLELDAKISPEEIERTLRGAASSPVVKALLAVITARMCEDSDHATDRPAVLTATTLPYTAEDRLYDSGRTSALAELLGFLQEATESKDSQTKAAA